MILKKTAAVIMAAAMMLGSTVLAENNAITASAAQDRSGICAVDYIDVRADADANSYAKGWLDGGDYITILGEKYDSNGKLWYRVLYELLDGYVPAECISEFTAQGSSSDYESYLESQGFPESYRVYLREMHRQHPNWIFEAQHVGIDWERAVSEETVIGRNLVHSYAPDSWKSMEKGAYDYSTGLWYQLDTGWVAASEGIIKYYLDPRNFINDDGIFMFENLSYDRNVQTRSGVSAILSGSFMGGDYVCPDTGEVRSYADTFIEAAETSGVSPYHLALRCLNEQGKYGAPQSLGTVEGYENYFNFFDVQAFATAAMTAGTKAAEYASTYDPSILLPWTNQYKSIIGGSIFLGNGYINRQQDTLYLQKFDMTDGGNGYFAHQYMTCVFGQATEARNMLNAYSSDVLATAMEFKIPVYDNMPSGACPMPGTENDSNDYLGGLSIEGVGISPAFSSGRQEYTATVNADSVKISAWAESDNSSVYGTGNVSLVNGKNVVKVTCISAGGTSRVYTITIQNNGGTKAVSPSVPKTADCDINGDGSANITDASVVLAHVSGKKAMKKDCYQRADIDGNGIVNIKDGMVLVKMLGIK